MSVSEVTARITQIQGQLALLGPTRGTRGTTSGTAFASALAGALDGAAGTTGALGTTSVTASGATGLDAAGEKVVAEARKYLGVPYVWGGTDPAKGLDCSGLVQLVYRNLGVELPRVSRDQAQQGTPVAGLDEARPGDLVAFGSPVRHIGIYIGGGKMIEAPRPGLQVRVADVTETPTAIRRVLDDAAVARLTGGLGTAGTTGTTGTTMGTGPAGDVPYADLFDIAGARYGVDPRLLAAIAKQESGFDPRAVSPAGAQGLMQLMPGTARGLGVTDSFDPVQAVDGAARLVDQLLDRFGSTRLALAAYNAGPGAVIRYGGVPPYAETQNYVASILGALGAA